MKYERKKERYLFMLYKNEENSFSVLFYLLKNERISLIIICAYTFLKKHGRQKEKEI